MNRYKTKVAASFIVNDIRSSHSSSLFVYLVNSYFVMENFLRTINGIDLFRYDTAAVENKFRSQEFWLEYSAVQINYIFISTFIHLIYYLLKTFEGNISSNDLVEEWIDRLDGMWKPRIPIHKSVTIFSELCLDPVSLLLLYMKVLGTRDKRVNIQQPMSVKRLDVENINPKSILKFWTIPTEFLNSDKELKNVKHPTRTKNMGKSFQKQTQ